MTIRRLPYSLPLLLGLACGDNQGGDLPPGSRRVELVQYASCSTLEADIKSRAIAELDAIMAGYGQGGWGVDDGGDPAAEDGDSAGGGEGGGGDGRTEGEDFSGTNNQEDGVDEADLVKTDGYEIYLVNGNRLHVFGVPTFGQLDAQSETEIEGVPQQLLLDADNDRVAVFSMVYVDTLPEDHPMRQRLGRQEANDVWSWRTWAISKITLLDVSDPTAPALERELWLEGWYQTARRNEHSARVVANGQILIPGLDDWWLYAYDANGNPLDEDAVRAAAEARINAADVEDLIPRMYERLPSGAISVHSLAGTDCHEFYYPTDSAGRGTTSIISVDLASDDLDFDADTIVANWATVYASNDHLYLAEWAWDWWWGYYQLEPGEVFTAATNLHAFDISQAGKTSYLGSGRIDGTVVNQFALDEEDGLLRVAATTQPWRIWSEDTANEPQPVPESHVYVLERNGSELDVVGHLGGIAPNESIQSARFTGDKGFVVTFQQIDPLFTIDLSNPRTPRLAGELEVFGFSSYLHPIADGRLLSIGVGGDENGANWRTQVSMFDVSDFDAPSLVDSEELATEGYAWSEAQWEHKAFQYFAPAKLLAVPVSSWIDSYDQDTDTYTYTWTSKLELISVDTDTGLGHRGSIDHSSYYNNLDQEWWSSPEVRRSIFMGDFIYAISARAITVHALDDLDQVQAQPLPGPTADQYYYWWW
ncbi:MAG TPA: beta-propeller domain-containing protein [Kofleriaceae bacterium]|nr:beta-propeller domain-containing protein [Kofleriaceae bacterium]